jgi:diacylglycerol kinase
MTYESGLFIAFLLWIYGLVMTLVSINSQMEKNLNKIGVRLSWVNQNAKDMTYEDVDKPFWKSVLKFLLLAAFGFVLMFLSWIQVAMTAGMIVWKWHKDSGTPQVIKEFRWKMRNLDLTRDQVIEELAKTDGIAPENYETYKQTLLQQMRERGLTVSDYNY